MICETCKGQGFFNFCSSNPTCTDCNGTGKAVTKLARGTLCTLDSAANTTFVVLGQNENSVYTIDLDDAAMDLKVFAPSQLKATGLPKWNFSNHVAVELDIKYDVRSPEMMRSMDFVIPRFMHYTINEVENAVRDISSFYACVPEDFLNTTLKWANHRFPEVSMISLPNLYQLVNPYPPTSIIGYNIEVNDSVRGLYKINFQMT